jgi:hypothetical protein
VRESHFDVKASGVERPRGDRRTVRGGDGSHDGEPETVPVRLAQTPAPQPLEWLE